MEFLLNFLLNYITLSVAGIAFVLILAVLIRKRKTLASKDKDCLSFYWPSLPSISDLSSS